MQKFDTWAHLWSKYQPNNFAVKYVRSETDIKFGTSIEIRFAISFMRFENLRAIDMYDSSIWAIIQWAILLMLWSIFKQVFIMASRQWIRVCNSEQLHRLLWKVEHVIIGIKIESIDCFGAVTIAIVPSMNIGHRKITFFSPGGYLFIFLEHSNNWRIIENIRIHWLNKWTKMIEFQR